VVLGGQLLVSLVLLLCRLLGLQGRQLSLLGRLDLGVQALLLV
jgi:hypothetical protein